MADYYPIRHCVENNIELLTDRVRNGYSIVVFPEGTRSVDQNIKRFHKGAFFLAEKLQLDILPIMIHGSGYTMTKGDFLLKNGHVTLKFLPRISLSDLRFGKGYSERTKKISRYFKEQYARLREEAEQPAFFLEQLRYNFIYKGPVIEWYMRIKLRIEHNYQMFHDLLPKNGKILDLGCGYGFMSYLLHFTSPGRRMVGVDYDEEKIEVANHCFSKDDRINFLEADIKHLTFESYDGIILSDVLHYLDPEEQKKLLSKCICHLNPSGVILVRDGDSDLESKHRKTKLTEFFSTRMFGFNKTSGQGLRFFSAGMVQEMAILRNMNCREINESKYTSNKLFVIEHTERNELKSI
jgi:uncharacterized protein